MKHYTKEQEKETMYTTKINKYKNNKNKKNEKK